MITTAIRWLAWLAALVSVATALTFALFMTLVPPEPPPMPAGDTAAWWMRIEQEYMASFPPLGRMFGSYSVDQVEFCHEPMVDPGPETFRYSSWQDQALECESAARTVRTRYLRCAGMLVGLWSLAAVLFAVFARRPRRAPLVGIAVSALLTSPIGTEQLLGADYWPDMFALFFPALAAVMLLGILRVIERWPKASPSEGPVEAGQRAYLGGRATVASLFFLGGLGTIAGGAHEGDPALIKAGVGLCLSAFGAAVVIVIRLKRMRAEAPPEQPGPPP